MQNKYLRILAVAVVCVCRSGYASETTFRGEVHSDSPILFHATVELRDLQNHSAGASDVNGDGTFEFHNLPYGEYHLTLLAGGEQPIYDELVSVTQPAQNLVVQLPHQENLRPASSSVSVTQLLHPPSKKAAEAFRAAHKFSDARQYDRAAEQLEKAVQLSPDFADAWVNLAAQHLRLGFYREALDELARARGIVRPTAVMECNTGVAMLMLHRDSEAAASAREALRLDSSYAQAHLLLGSLLAANPRTMTEALAHLEIAARTIPSAEANAQRLRLAMSQTVSHP